MPGKVATAGPLEAKLGRFHGGRVLDVATGAGGFLRVLAESLSEYDEIVGIDTSDKAMQTGREELKLPGVTFVKMDAAALEFDDASFDTVAISNSLHHMAGPGDVLAGMMRVLRPGGLFVVREMFRDDQSAPQMTHVLFHHLRADIDQLRGMTHRRSYLRRELVAIVEGLGLKEMDVFDVGPGDADPMEKEGIDHLEQMIDAMLAHPEDYGHDQAFKVRGEELKEHVRKHGFLPATSLVALGRKPD